MAKTGEWSGLKSLWSVVKQILSILAMTAFGATVGGFTLGAATFFCYFIGVMAGAPIGAMVGAFYGSKMAPRDVAIVFVGASAAVWPATLYGKANSWDDLFTTGLGLAAYSLVGLLLLASIRQIFDERTRWWLAVLLANTFWITAFIRFLSTIYR